MSKGHVLTQEDRRNGGKSTRDKHIHKTCPHCGKSYTRQLSLNGHLSRHSYANRYHNGDLNRANRDFARRGLKGYADRYHDGDLEKARQSLPLLGQAAQDPAPWNGAFERAHETARQIAAKRRSP